MKDNRRDFSKDNQINHSNTLFVADGNLMPLPWVTIQLQQHVSQGVGKALILLSQVGKIIQQG